jgi:hypothetical protein
MIVNELLNWRTTYSYVTHTPTNTPHIPLRTFAQRYRPESNILPYKHMPP